MTKRPSFICHSIFTSPVLHQRTQQVNSLARALMRSGSNTLVTINLVICVTLAVILHSSAPAEELAPKITERIDHLVELSMERGGVPGLSIAVAIDNQLAYEKAYGLSDVENKVTATPNTRFRTASISKPMTAVIALRLAEQRKLDLDSPVQSYLPEFPRKRWPLTARPLLSHLGGIRHYSKPGESTGKTFHPSVRGALQLFAEDPLLHEPGTKYQYTTYGYNLLGAIAEAAASSDFESLLRQIVTEPAFMTSTCIDSHSTIIPNRARGYARRKGVLVNAEMHDTSMKIPGGGLLSTAGDLVRFATSVNTGMMLNPESVDAMWTRQHTNDGKQIEYGLGWKISPDNVEPKSVSHGGAQAGTATLLMLKPDEGKAIAVMCNLEGTKLLPLVKVIFELLE